MAPSVDRRNASSMAASKDVLIPRSQARSTSAASRSRRARRRRDRRATSQRPALEADLQPVAALSREPRLRRYRSAWPSASLRPLGAARRVPAPAPPSPGSPGWDRQAIERVPSSLRRCGSPLHRRVQQLRPADAFERQRDLATVAEDAPHRQRLIHPDFPSNCRPSCRLRQSIAARSSVRSVSSPAGYDSRWPAGPHPARIRGSA